MEIKITYRVYELRIKNNLSLEALSQTSGISKSQINNIENGLKHPTVPTLCMLAVALNVRPEQLFSFEIL